MLYSKKLAKFKNLIHGFTTKREGDFRKIRALTKHNRRLTQRQTIVRLCAKAGYDGNLIVPEQVHGNNVAVVSKKENSQSAKGVDGLLTQEKGLALGITTADCLPLLFYEPVSRIIAAVHAGWQGTLRRIGERTVQKISGLGGKVDRITVAIGPHIQKCCYDVDAKRATVFEKEFGNSVITRRDKKFFLDLAKANLNQLLARGVLEENIELLPFCTACDENFYSFRKDKENYGKILTIIGMTKTE